MHGGELGFAFDDLRFRLLCLGRVLVVAGVRAFRIRGDDVDFDPWRPAERRVGDLGAGAAGLQSLLRAVRRTAERRVEQRGEDLVQGREQVGVAAEVVGEVLDAALGGAGLQGRDHAVNRRGSASRKP